MEKFYYTISEVSELLEETPTVVRYWSNTFSKYVKPHRNGKGNRLYQSEDVEALKQIRYLVREKKMKLSGVENKLKEERSSVDRSVKALDSLKEIRNQLVEIRKNL